MNKSDFRFDLPPELIAQTPIAHREQSRLMCLDRRTGETSHRRFFELPGLLRGDDCLVINNTRVIPAKLIGRKDTGGAIEVVLLRGVDPGGADAQRSARDADCAKSTTTWECLVRPGRRVHTGTRLLFGDGELTGIVIGETDGGNRHIEFEYYREIPAEGERNEGPGGFLDILERFGKTPLPPYIHEELEDSERYQTVYARVSGSAAAPTAGLHFTGELLDEIRSRGVKVCHITLHVGLGTFRPVKTAVIEEHKMHSEYFTISGETAETVNSVKSGGGRVIAVGTTSCRTLEACADKSGAIRAMSGSTDIFIYPGYEFRCIGGLITNFHLPESTLIMLVSAFAGRGNVLRAYEEAIQERYRFFSFGDAMMIV